MSVNSILIQTTVTKTVTASNAVVATGATALDTAMTAAMSALVDSPPTGFQDNSIQVQPQSLQLIYDGTVYVFCQQFTYTTLTVPA